MTTEKTHFPSLGCSTLLDDIPCRTPGAARHHMCYSTCAADAHLQGAHSANADAHHIGVHVALLWVSRWSMVRSSWCNALISYDVRIRLVRYIELICAHRRGAHISHSAAWAALRLKGLLYSPSLGCSTLLGCTQ